MENNPNFTMCTASYMRLFCNLNGCVAFRFFVKKGRRIAVVPIFMQLTATGKRKTQKPAFKSASLLLLWVLANVMTCPLSNPHSPSFRKSEVNEPAVHMKANAIWSDKLHLPIYTSTSETD